MYKKLINPRSNYGKWGNLRIFYIIPAIIYFFLLMGNIAIAQERIIDIEVRGNKRIEASTILSNISTRKGEFLSQSKVSRDIKRIFSLGFFNDVRVEKEEVPGGIKLIYIVDEKPTIKGVYFEGNKVLDSEKLRSESTLLPDSILNRNEINNTINKIRAKYQEEGYYLVDISYRLRPLPRNSVDVVFRIKEGKKVVLKKIYFEGNKSFSDDLLKKIMKTKEDWLFGWATQAGDFKEEEFKTDMQRLDSFYQDNGFIEVEIGDPKVEMNADRTKIYITIPIKEGRQFRIGNLEFEGNTLLSDKQVADIFGLREGSVFSRGRLEKGLADLSDFYAQKGYLFSDIAPIRKYREKEPVVDLKISIDKGEKFYIGQIEITGNTKTLDKVIRRELLIREGDQASSLKLRRSKDDVFKLGYFGDIKIKTKRGEKRNLIDVEINVEEKPTGTLTFGGGFSSAEKLVGIVSVSEENLFGRGWQAAVSGQFSTRTTEFDLSFVDPYFLDRYVSAGFDLYNSRTEDFSEEFWRKQTGFRLKFGWRLFERVWMLVAPRTQRDEISSIDFKYYFRRGKKRERNTEFYKDLKDLEGSNTQNSIYFSIYRKTYNHPVFPTKGSNIELSYEPAGGPLGGDISYYRIILDTSYYHPWKWGTAFHIRGLLGYVDDFSGDRVPTYEKFKLGGSRTIRGYDNEDIGPKDRFDNNVGGNKEFVLNLEYIVPILPNQFQLVAFYDMGDAVKNSEQFSISDMKKSVGIGARLFLPIGPVRLDLGYKLDKEKGESATQFHFGVGGQFF
ncbi:MAG: outer membrane protein assembly factor BamA [Candidatus Schekmanbacteria bacterium]|nr:MAG: outer membrane protein assembly factor BamA [Candidatus Schekmanbacteria bacterium]